MSAQTDAGHSQNNSVQHIAALRARLWDAGFRAVPIYNHNSTLTKSPGKAPKGDDWTEKARRNPPAAVVVSPDLEALNTGILCDGLRPLDIDIDNPTIAHSIKAKALSRFGECPMRYRDSGPRVLLLYRAADGQPKKRWVAGSFGKVEVLGRGQQFVAFGVHHSGSTLRWMPEAPGDVTVASLPAITEDDVTAFLAEAALSIGARPEHRTDTASPRTSQFGLRADSLQVLTALHSIPNNGPADWELWNRLGMAIWAATGGSTAGRAAFHAWSEEHPDYDQQETDRRWDHYSTSPPTQIGAGSLFHLAKPPKPQPQEQKQPEQQTYTGLPIEYFDAIEKSLKANDFVEGLLIERGAGVVYGESNCGKTFWVSDLALCVASGLPWNGREVIQGGVVYACLEGGFGFRNRIAAWREERADDRRVCFAAIAQSINLLDPTADTGKLIRAVKDVTNHFDLPVKLVVVDTLSRALSGGNENSPEAMGALVANMDRIRQETGAFVIFVHHSGKDAARGSRGHSSLRAAIDTEIEVIANGSVRTATVVKQRDLETVGEFPFQLRVVELGKNDRGKPVTSCVVEAGEAMSPVGDIRPIRVPEGQPKLAHRILCDLIAQCGEPGHGAPSGCLSVPADWWRDRFYDRAMPASDRKTQEKGFRRAADALTGCGAIACSGGRVWLC